MPATCLLGVDVGGTAIAAGLARMNGTLLRSQVVPTPARATTEALLDCLASLVEQVGADPPGPILGVGVGVPAAVDVGTGVGGAIVAGGLPPRSPATPHHREPAPDLTDFSLDRPRAFGYPFFGRMRASRTKVPRF